MAVVTETLRRPFSKNGAPQKGTPPAPEPEAQGSMGVVVVIFGINPETGEPEMFSVKEGTDKSTTNKKAGLNNLISETRKEDEGIVGNMLGALGEFTDDTGDLGRLYIVPGYSLVTMPIQTLSYGGRPVDLALLFYEGPLDPSRHSLDSGETVPNGWMSASQIEGEKENFREIAYATLGFVSQEGLMQDFLARVVYPESRVPVSALVDPGFSLPDFIQQRETRPDIPLA